jgi:TatA/E family protein of Tat protein translocase
MLISAPIVLANVLGGWEIVLVTAIVLILHGAKGLPGISRRLGAGLTAFKNAVDDEARGAGESIAGIHGKHAAQALTSENQTAELYDPAVFGREVNGFTRPRPKRHRKWWRIAKRFVTRLLRMSDRA